MILANPTFNVAMLGIIVMLMLPFANGLPLAEGSEIDNKITQREIANQQKFEQVNEEQISSYEKQLEKLKNLQKFLDRINASRNIDWNHSWNG